MSLYPTAGAGPHTALIATASLRDSTVAFPFWFCFAFNKGDHVAKCLHRASAPKQVLRKAGVINAS